MSIVRSLKVTLWRVVRGDAGAREGDEKKSWKGFVKRIFEKRIFWIIPKPIFVIALMLLVVLPVMNYLGWFRGFETWHLDTLIRFWESPLWGSPKVSKNITIVEINEQDYQKIFDGTSPLDKKTLMTLIGAVEKYHPRVIGVDIDTSDWFAACERHRPQKPAQCTKDCEESLEMLRKLRVDAKKVDAKKKGTIIVWAAVPRTPGAPLKLIPRPGSAPLESDVDVQGVPQFPVDPDGSVRHFDGRVEVEKGTAGCPEDEKKKCYVPTFARAIYEKYTGYSPEAQKLDERVIFNFHGDRYQFPIIDAKQFLLEDVNKETRTKEEIDRIEDRRKAQFENQVVLIGGSFPEARDAYFTPKGFMPGVWLNALAIQTELDGGGIRDITRLWEFLIDIGVGFYIVGMFYLFDARPWKAVSWSAVVVPIAFVSSLVLFRTPAYWFNFIPVAAGVFLHQLFELAEGGSEAQEKLRELRREQERVEVDVATVEELAVSEIAGPGSVDQTVENTKVKGAAGGAA